MFSAAAVAFLVAALLILLVFRLAFGRRLRMTGGRSRQPRLGIVDAFDVDRQRQLVIIRRDNTEHLLMIGGPNDLLIEPSIVRAEGARDALRRDKDAEPKLGSSGAETAPGRSLEDAIGAALNATPPVPPGPSIPPPRAPVLPLPPRQRMPLSTAASSASTASPPQPVVAAPPPAAAPAAVLPPAATLQRKPTVTEMPPVPRPPLLRVPPLRPAPRAAPAAPPPPSEQAGAAPPTVGPAPEPPPAGAPPAPEITAEKKPEPAGAGQLDTFESLEEEMAKLLGRGGPGGN